MAPIQVDLWQWSLATTATEQARFMALLSPEECARAATIGLDERRAQFIAGRGRVREILAAIVGIAAHEVAFRTGAHGKLAIADIPGAPEFNLSHTDDVAVLGVCRSHAIGVDIETVRVRGHDIAERYFALSEAAAIAALPPAERPIAFVRLWAMKEAVVKATGEGLSRPFKSFEVSLDPAAVVSFTGHPASHWRLIPFDLAPGIVGAVALDAGESHTVVDLVRRV